MIGYHYTTRRNWEEGASLDGLVPATIREHELIKFRGLMPDMQDTAVWVWTHLLDQQQAWIVTALLGCIHNDFDLVLLEVEYDETDTMTHNFGLHPNGDMARQTCNFSAANLNTGDLYIDLLTNTIPPSQLTKIWEADLLSQFPPEKEKICV